ncbi:MAG: hypothetical protein CMJ31_07720 [Phycisphaerae bacterium]|nr:hypothetical protein [Phycisphaerae bacterium]
MDSLRTVTCTLAVAAGALCSVSSASEGVFESMSMSEARPIVRQLALQIMQNTPGMKADTLNGAQAPTIDGLVPTDERYLALSAYVSPAYFARASEDDLARLMRMLDTAADYVDRAPPAMCFAPGTDPEFVNAMEALLLDLNPIAFQQIGRWSGTTLTPGSNSQGEPATLTYSFVPDGTTIPADIGLPGGSSQLFQWLDGIYGHTETWQTIFHQEFERWGSLIGVTYVYEPNDDGAPTSGPSGSAGVRGDLRIGAYQFSSNNDGGTLAYNNFPQDGDMIFDAYDAFYDNTSNSSRGFRNTIAHEHGHGAGMLHVCPRDGTKLMEPFINTGFLGGQIDDVLNGQRHYGDNFEPNDSVVGAPLLGTFGGIDIQTVRNLSIDDNSDIDYFDIEVTEAVDITVRATPAAAAYDQGPQTGSCSGGSFTDYNIVHDLNITLIGPGGTVLAFADSTGLGSMEELESQIASPGVYTISVNGGSANSIQLYDLQIITAPPPFIAAQILNASTPNNVDPGSEVTITFDLDLNDETPVTGPNVRYRFDDGPFLSATAALVGGETYSATLPAVFCEDDLEYYIEFEGNLAGLQTVPADGFSNPITVLVGEETVVFEDDFNLNRGWSVSGTVSGAAEGEWQRGRPLGDGSRGDPTTDADGSVQCFVTGNGAGNTDVDGTTILTSPVFNATEIIKPTVSYYRWLDNNDGDNPSTDTLDVEISNNGGASWSTLETVGPTGAEASGGWFFVEYLIEDFLTPGPNMRVRFIADDSTGGASIMECGVDGFSVGGALCTNPTGPTPCNGADLAEPFEALDIADVVAFLGFFGQGDAQADLSAPFGEFDIADVVAFLTEFGAGCPE